MNLYDKASLIITPNAYKTSKIYAAKPIDGSGDLVFTRASNAQRRNNLGLWETLGNNIPRLNYPSDGSCPYWIFEAQKTNSLLTNTDLNSWSKGGGATVNDNIIASPISAVLADRLNVDAAAYVFRGSLSIANDTQYTVSCFVKNDTLAAGERIRLVLSNNQLAPNSFSLIINVDINAGTALYTVSGTAVTGCVAGSAYGSIDALGDGWYFIQVTGTTGTGAVSAVSSLEFYSPDGTKSYFAIAPQLEIGGRATSPIITAGSAVTRIADAVPIITNASLFGPSGEFTWNISVRNNFAFSNPGTHVNGPYIMASGGNGLWLASLSSGRLSLWTAAASIIFQTTADTCNLVITSNGSVINVWQNGVKVVANYAYAIPANSYGINAPNAYIHMKPFNLFPQVLTDAECLALSNL